MCLMQFVLQEMHLAKDHDGQKLFDDDVIKKVTKMALDGWLDKLYFGKGLGTPSGSVVASG